VKIPCLVLSPAMAWCVAMNLKPLETRTRRMNYRGPLAIAAAKKLNQKHYDYLKSVGIQLPHKGELVYGKIVATTTVVDCVTFTKDLEKFALWPVFDGFGIWLNDTKMLDRPVPVKGRLGLFEVTI
jgi:hypothetical protein